MAHLASSRRNLSIFLLAACLVMLVAFLALPWLSSFAQGVIRGGVAMPTSPRALQVIQFGGLDFGGTAVLLIAIMLGSLLLGICLGVVGLFGQATDPKAIAATATRILGIGWAIVLPGAIFAILTLRSDTYLPSLGFLVMFLGGFVLVMVAALVLRRLKGILAPSNGGGDASL